MHYLLYLKRNGQIAWCWEAPKSPGLSANALSPPSCREEGAGKAQGIACHGRPSAALQAQACAEDPDLFAQPKPLNSPSSSGTAFWHLFAFRGADPESSIKGKSESRLLRAWCPLL